MLNILLPLSKINTVHNGHQDIPIISLRIKGKTLLEWALEPFLKLPNTHICAILGNDMHTPSIAQNLPDTVSILHTQGDTRGATCTCLYAHDILNAGLPLLVSSLDHFISLDVHAMTTHLQAQQVDASSVIFPSDGNPIYSYAEIRNGKITRALEKQSITNTAMAGVYYFSTTNTFFDHAKNLIRKQTTQYQDGYFISGVLNEMVLSGLDVVPYEQPDLSYFKVYDIPSYNTLCDFMQSDGHMENTMDTVHIHKLRDFVRGWIVGDFSPSLYKTQDFECAIQRFTKGQKEAVHTHKIATEITVIISGRAEMCGKQVVAGDIIVVKPYEYTGFEALEDTVTAVVKIPGAKNDKYSKDTL